MVLLVVSFDEDCLFLGWFLVLFFLLVVMGFKVGIGVVGFNFDVVGMWILVIFLFLIFFLFCLIFCFLLGLFLCV